MSTPAPIDLQVTERIEAARAEVRRSVAAENVALIHPFDMAALLKNPTVIDAVLINMFDRQFIVVDGIVYEQTCTVRNTRKLSEMMTK